MLSQHDSQFVLLTGSTGFVGHRLLVELLREGRRCAVTLRSPIERSISALANLLSDFDVDVREAIARELIVPIECDLRDGLPRLQGVMIGTVAHAAASTRFDADATGEPANTNVVGTRRLLEWCAAADISDFHLVSSAYACGRWPRWAEVPETFHNQPTSFHNDYEASKWEAEQACRAWATAVERRNATIYRPSVVVGEFNSGRATKFDAFYVPVRATEVLSRVFARPGDARRWAVPLRIKGRPRDCQNIVPVDFVASMIARLLADPTARGRVYHLTHPTPPTNAQIKVALEEHFRLGGGRFVEPEALECAALNEYERLFADVSRPVEHYLVDTPHFARSNTAAAERAFGVHCPAFDANALRRLFSYAQSVDWADSRRRWRQRAAATVAAAPALRSACARYFEEFLPAHVNGSKVARMTGLSVTVRFEIEDEPRGEWVCRFERGRLVQVLRTPAAAGVRADFGYRSTLAGFWKSISGRHHPQQLFLKGHARITGDVERALKMAMILHAFAREFPCDEPTLMACIGSAAAAVTKRSCA